ncbi:MAG: hypothetical protein ACFCU7_03095 [Pleurocapsa sp.]
MKHEVTWFAACSQKLLNPLDRLHSRAVYIVCLKNQEGGQRWFWTSIF